MSKATVVVSQPSNDAVFVGGTPVSVELQVTGDVAQLVVRVNGSPFKSFSAGPYTTQWTPPATGNFQIDAVAEDKSGNSVQSLPVMVTVKPAAALAAAPAKSGSSPARAPKIPTASASTQPATGFWGVWGTASRTESGVASERKRLQADGFPTGVVLTSEWSNLNSSPWYAVFIGPYSTQSAAKDALSAAKANGYKDYYVKFSGDLLAGD